MVKCFMISERSSAVGTIAISKFLRTLFKAWLIDDLSWWHTEYGCLMYSSQLNPCLKVGGGGQEGYSKPG